MKRRGGAASWSRLWLAVWLTWMAVNAACTIRVSDVAREHLVPAAAPADVSYADQLIALARRLHLSERPDWHKLVHYQPSMFGGWKSEADGPSFFLAKDGKDDPDAELEATIHAFFAAVAPGSPKDLQHPICQFPARLMWLGRELSIDLARLPHAECTRYDEFRQTLDVASISLVFSSYYLNNPASAFGHTFLLVNSHRNQGNPDRALLDFAINFSATTDTNNAVFYALKGILGAFPGEFSRVPYYLQVRKYNDYESRDMWLYTLALSQRETDMVIAHIWELGSTWFDYYYMTENCSYHILGAIEAAVPRLDLLDKTRVPVAPADTVKIVTDVPGLVTDVKFRPAIRTSVTARMRGLTADERSLAAALAQEPKTPWPADLALARKILVLDAATDVIDMHYARELPFNLDGPGAHLKQQLLERRAELAVPSDPLRVEAPVDKRPDAGHGSRRVGIAGGVDTDGSPTVGFNVRLTLHDLGDPANGYPDTASLEFLPVSARVVFDADKTRFRLDDAQLVRITSISPLTEFEHKISFKIQAGAVYLDDTGCHICTAARISGGGGVAFGTRGGGFLIWGMGDAQAVSARGLDGVDHAPVRLGLGPSGGMRLRLSPDAALLVTGEWIWLPGQVTLASYLVNGTLRWRFSDELALFVAGDLRNAGAGAGVEGQAGLFVYY